MLKSEILPKDSGTSVQPIRARPESFAPESILRNLSLDQTVFGTKACSALPELLYRISARRVLQIRDPVATEACNVSTSLSNCLSVERACGIFDIQATISPSEVDRLGTLCMEDGYDCIVAVGGGATIDAAKLIALRASNSLPLSQLIGGGFAPNRIPLIAVPTTAGSGSEATHFAVIFIDQEKFSVAHPSLRPQWAVVDPTLTHSAPQRVAAAAGLDALCQSIESLWSVRADAKSIEIARIALQLIVQSLHAAVIERRQQAQRELSLGSHLAGQAINRSFTTVCHALSYPLTAHHGILHGFATAATLPAALLFNSHELETNGSNANMNGHSSQFLKILMPILGCSDIDSAVSRLVRLIRSVGGAASVSELQLPHDYQPLAHAEKIDPHRLQNNPRTVAIDDSLSLLLTKFDVDGRVRL